MQAMQKMQEMQEMHEMQEGASMNSIQWIIVHVQVEYDQYE